MALLTDNLIAFWQLEEASGVRYDSEGSNNLTDNNTVTSATGVVGDAGQFTRSNSEYLSIADNSSLSMGDIDFTLVAWTYLDTKTNGMGIMSKFVTTGGKREYAVEYEPSVDRFQFVVSATGSSGTYLQAGNFGSPSTAAWIFIIAWHDSSANTINIKVNNGTANSSSYSSGVNDDTSPFVLGATNTGAGFMDGRIDQVGVWKRVLTADEQTFLYNSGNGRAYAGLDMPGSGSPSYGAAVGSVVMY